MNEHIGDAVPPEMLEEVRRLEAMRDEEIDRGDMPEAMDWSSAVQGRYHRPIKTKTRSAARSV